MNNSFSIWFKLIPEGWKFFGAIVGFGTIIWVTAITVDHWQDKGSPQILHTARVNVYLR
jgi:type IV secretory pathway TrbD component